MSTQQGVTTAAAPAEGATTQTPPAENTVPDFATSIAASLTAGNAPEIPDPVSAKPTPRDPEPKPEPTPTPKVTGATPEAKAPEPTPDAKVPEAEPKPETKPAHPYDEDDDPRGEIDPKFTKIRADFEKMREKLRKAREDGQYGRLLAQTAARAKMTPEAVAKFVDLGARLNLSDPAAVEEFRQLGSYLGIYPTAPAAPAAPQPPAAPPITEEQRLKAVADTIYNEDFAEDVKS